METYGQARAKYSTFVVTNPQVAVGLPECFEYRLIILKRLVLDDKVGRVGKKSREKKSDDPERAKRREEVYLGSFRFLLNLCRL